MNQQFVGNCPNCGNKKLFRKPNTSDVYFCEKCNSIIETANIDIVENVVKFDEEIQLIKDEFFEGVYNSEIHVRFKKGFEEIFDEVSIYYSGDVMHLRVNNLPYEFTINLKEAIFNGNFEYSVPFAKIKINFKELGFKIEIDIDELRGDI